MKNNRLKNEKRMRIKLETKNKNKNLLTKRVSLKQKLDSIYNIHDLETTCNHSCLCCKTACPSMNYSEFLNIINEVWDGYSKEDKIALINKSIEYFFRHDFDKFGMGTMIKPSMLLEDNGLCKHYDRRPLSCRIYGLWPEETYNARVDKFEKAYEGKLTRDQLPLNTQCKNVKRKNVKEPLKIEEIESLYSLLDDVDLFLKEFTSTQIANKNNYRTFHDWLLLKVLGEEVLSNLTTFLLAANKEAIEDQILQIKKIVTEKLINNMPNLSQEK